MQEERSVVSVGPDVSAWRVADEMDAHSVGSVVVVDEAQVPIGIVTDRDLMRRVVAPGLDENKVTARDVMSTDLVLGKLEEPETILLERMRKHGVRRIPLLRNGRLAGIAALDDIIFDLSASLWNVSEAIRVELRETMRTSPRRRRNERREEIFEEARRFLRDVRGSEDAGGELRSFLDWLARGPS